MDHSFPPMRQNAAESPPPADASPHWPGEMGAVVDAFLLDAASVACGRFALDGTVRAANRGMRWILQDETALRAPTVGAHPGGASARHFMSPSFPELVRTLRESSGRYTGMLTCGDCATVYRSVRATARLIGDEVLILADFDVAELEKVNHEVAALNSEVVNLQRSLVSEKHALTRALAELKQAQAMLVQSEKMNALGRLVAGVAHEINNPIAFVDGNLHTLGRSLGELLDAYEQLQAEALAPDAEGRRERVAAIRKAADLDFVAEDLEALLGATREGIARVKRIVEDLRTFSRLDEALVQEADLASSLRSTLALVRPTLEDADVTVVYDERPLPRLRCKPVELSQVFLNVVVNATQAVATHRPGQGRIEVRARDEGGAQVFEFEDNGGGIPAAIRPRIFDPFFTTRPVGQGIGLGLSLAHRIVVEGHGGSIDVDSVEGRGTTIRVRIPRLPP